jgi:hypothetical protein
MNDKLVEKVGQFQWELFDHPPYSPDQVPIDFSLVPPPQNFPSIVEHHGRQRAEISGGKLAEHTGSCHL